MNPRVLQELAAQAPVLARELERRVDAATLARVLDLLEKEGVPTRDLRAIAEALVSINGSTTADGQALIVFPPNTANFWARRPEAAASAEILADTVRLSLKRAVSHVFSSGGDFGGAADGGIISRNSQMSVLLLSPELERQCQVGDMPDKVRRRLLAGLRENLPQHADERLCLLTTVEIRRRVRDAIAADFPDVPVVCYQELWPELNIKPLARLS